MRLLNLSWPTWMIGLVGLAGLLFLLQRLRVRYREQTVVTTMFWKEALEEARARVLVRRFRHLLAYLLVLLICALMWFGFADPRGSGGAGRQHLVLLDGSAAMGHGTLFANSVELLDQQLRELPDDNRRVVLCAGSARTLLAPGESSLLLESRLAGIQPAACPATVDATLRDLLSGLSAGQATTVTVVGTAPISQVTVDALPAGTRIQRLAPPAGDRRNNAILALGVSRSLSGAFDRVDVLCQIRGDAGPHELRTTLDGQAMALSGKLTQAAANSSRIVFADLPADGQILGVELTTGDDDPIDNQAAIRLPRRQRIRVQIADASLQQAIGAALAADPAVLVVDDTPDVVVTSGADLDPAQAGLQFVSVAAQADTVVLHHRDDDETNEHDILSLFSQLGISEVDAMDAAQATGRTISIGAAVTPAARRITMWNELLDSRFNFVQSRSFPLFVARALRWLAGVEEDPAFVAAGLPAPLVESPRLDASGRRLDPVGADFVPPVAGAYRHADGSSVVAALPGGLHPTAAATLAEVSTDDDGGGFDWGFCVALAVLLLLLVEWFFLLTGRMP